MGKGRQVVASRSQNNGGSADLQSSHLGQRMCYAKCRVLAVLFVSISLVMASCGAGEGKTFDGARAYGYVVEQVSFGPRPSGSEALRRTADYIIGNLEGVGWRVWAQEFTYQGVALRNIFATRSVGKPRDGAILLGAHYDTRPRADREANATRRDEAILGANDGASGVAVLLELARVFEAERCGKGIILAFFDAEDSGGINGWPFSVGAEAAAEELAPGLGQVIIVDMVGDADQQFYYERGSDSGIQQELWSIAKEIGYGKWFIPEPRHGVMDDHVPFMRRGVPSVDIIDFDYAYWHTLQDTADKVSGDSLERVGRVLLEYLYRQ